MSILKTPIPINQGGTGSTTGATVSGGGTGDTSFTAYAVITGGTTSTGALQNVAPSSTSGVPLISQGTTSLPTFGTAVVAGGGTGKTSLTAYAILAGGTTSTGVLQQVSGVGTSGQVLTSNGAGALPTWQAASGIKTINGNTGSVTGSTVTIQTGSPAGSTAGSPTFGNSSTTSTLQFYDANTNVVLGGGINANLTSGTSANVGLGYTIFNAITTASSGVAIGKSALQNLTTGNSNTAVGFESMVRLTTGAQNTCIGGGDAGSFITTGEYNTFLGYGAGSGYTNADSSNITIANNGGAGESNTIRIGSQGSGTYQQNTCFIAGITGATVTGSAVLCSASGQLGTVASSERYKENIKDLPDDISILNLRPVEFNYKKDEKKEKKYGLIAEEVHKDFPYLCFYNDKKQPESVLYHELPLLLLKEIQRLNKRIEDLEKKL